MIRSFKRRVIIELSRLLIFIIGSISNFFNLTALEKGKTNVKIGYFISKLFSLYFINLLVYRIFFNEESKNATRLQEIETYKSYGIEYRKALLNIEKSLFGKILIWRNKNSKILKEQFKKEDVEGILFLTRSWHFFNPLYNKFENKFKNINKFDINDYDKIYLEKEKKINKNKFFRDLLFSSLRNASKLDNINNYDNLKKLNKVDLENIIKSDIIFVDWLNQNTLWVLENIPSYKKIIVRVHSYEVFSFYSLMLNYGKIDGLIFISEGIKKVFLELWGWLLPKEIEITVLQNVRSLDRLNIKKASDILITNRNKTLGMLQYNIEVKDLDFALDIFEKLYEKDNSFRLLLAGNKLDNKDDTSKKLLDRISSFPNDIIQELGYVTEMDKFFKKVGYILSTSKREGSHESVIEGMAFGCIPVIRDWPLLSPFSGAKLSFPQFPVFKSSAELVDYILNSQINFEEISNKSKFEVNYYFNKNIEDDYMSFIKKIRGKK